MKNPSDLRNVPKDIRIDINFFEIFDMCFALDMP